MWTNFLLKGDPIYKIFGDEIPSLKDSEIREMHFLAAGAAILLSIDIKDFPNNVPIKWRDFNTVTLELYLIGVSKVNINGWNNNIVADVKISNWENVIKIEMISINFYFVAECKFLDLSSIKAYLKLNSDT